jgi:hypothetical protein
LASPHVQVAFPPESTASTKVLPSLGTTEVDFINRIITYPVGVDALRTSLKNNPDHKEMHSLLIYSTQTIKIQFWTPATEGDYIDVPARSTQVFRRVSFTKLFIKHLTANTAIKFVASTDPEQTIQVFAQEVIMTNARYFVSSDPLTQFTGAIVLNANENEDISGLQDNEITITGLSVASKENRHYVLYLYESATFATPLDIVGSIDVDLPSYGELIGGYYCYFPDKLEVDYYDIDATQKLHVSLVNRSALAKSAGALGEVQFVFKYAPRV